jgi:hypothetical protein
MLTTGPAGSDIASPNATRWSPATRIAFRFCVVYVGLTILFTQLFGAVFQLPSPVFVTGVQDLFALVGTHVFHVGPITLQLSGSGDKLIDWVQAGTLFLIALLASAVWSLVSRRDSHPRAYRWFRLLVRFALGATMVRYGFSKVIPTQMPTVFLSRLVEPFGNFSPMGVLWTSIGASPAYESFTGAVELLGGVLLFFPRTTLLGALISLVATGEVFVLNMTYDVPVKLLSFHLVLMAVILLAPYASNLFDLLLRHRPLTPVEEPPIGRTPRRRRLALVAQAVYGLLIVLLAFSASIFTWSRFGAGAPKSPLYGIWNVEQMTIDSELRPPLVTDGSRWRRVIMQTPTAVVFQRMNDTFDRFTAEFGKDARTLKVTSVDRKTSSTLTYRRSPSDRLVLDGTLDGRLVHLELTQVDLNTFLLNNRGFHWIQEVPFNR